MTVINASYDSSGVSIPVKVFQPPTATPVLGALVVAYGTEGLHAPFGDLVDRQYCEVAANAGFVVLRPDYFVKTSTRHGSESVLMAIGAGASPKWVDAIADAVKWIPSQPFGVDPTKTGLVGFSLGANHILRAAIQLKKASPSISVGTTVAFFGPIDALPGVVIPAADIKFLPPTQIHHGTEDQFPNGVPYSESTQLQAQLLADGIDVDFHSYTGQGHPGQFTNSWTSTTQADASNKSFAFLRSRFA